MPRFDQHFLRDPSYVRRIIEAVAPLSEETILEVGPGQGALTRALLELPFPYIGIEIDRKCLALLRELPGAHKAQWIEGDFLEVALPEKPLYFVSNLPYSITGPALFRILSHRWWIREGIVMLQREVAQRLYAPAGKRPYGKLSVLFQSIYAVRRLLLIPPGAFSPPPEVWSEVIIFTRAPKLPLEAWDDFAEIVRAAFRQPRQTLGKNLRTIFEEIPASWRQRRPHELTIEAFLYLWETASRK